MIQDISYRVPSSWYNGLYKDVKPCCKAARSFSLKHEKKSDECWLLIHGYRGYPGELVRPAVDLYEIGFDVYVPRLPGNGTSKQDFINSGLNDWVGLAQNALNDLQKKYKKVNLLGHSLGTPIIAKIANEHVGKIVYASPSFINNQLNIFTRIFLGLMSIFTPTIKCAWQSDPRYHMHYENAPCDDNYLGHEYWQYLFTKKILECYKLMRLGSKNLDSIKAKQLVINPLLDVDISKPSIAIIGKRAKVVDIKNATHFVFYDIDPKAEEKAVKAVLDFARS